MATFKLFIQGSGEGCDYTIGCNTVFRGLMAANIHDAVAESIEIIKQYSLDQIETATLYEISNFHNIDIQPLREAKKELLEKEQEENMRRTYLHLKKKFEPNE